MTSQGPHAFELSIDPAAITTFAVAVFGHLDGYVPVRLISEKGTPRQRPISDFAPVAEVARTLVETAPNAAGTLRGVFVVPGTVAQPGRARAKDIQETAVLLVDLDDGDIAAQRAHLIRHLGAPSLEVASGGRTAEDQVKLHLYWRLTEAARGEDLALACALRDEMARKVGGDTSFGSPHQPIRVPGTLHGKNGLRAPVRLLAHSPLEYELPDLEEAIAAMPVLPGCEAAGPGARNARGRRERAALRTARASGPGPPAADLMTRRIHEGAVDEVTRFAALSRVIGHWLRCVRLGSCTLDHAWRAVTQYNAARIEPPWDETRLGAEFQALLRRDIENHGPMPSDGADPSRRSSDEASRTRSGAEGEKGNQGDPAPEATSGGGALPDEEPIGASVFPPHLSEDALASAFARAHGRAWRYVAAWGQWLHWTGTHWVRDEVGAVREAIRQVCRAAAVAHDKPAEARRVASERTIRAVERIAAADPCIATRAEDWDTDLMQLNTPAGLIDLESGEVLATPIPASATAWKTKRSANSSRRIHEPPIWAHAELSG